MVLGQVGERRHAEVHGLDAAKSQRMAGGFHHQMRAPGPAHGGRTPRNFVPFGSRQGGRVQLLFEGEPQGSQPRSATAGALDRVLSQIRRRRLAVGAGDPDHGDVSSGVMPDGLGGEAQGHSRVADHEERHGDVRNGRPLLDHHRVGAARHGIDDELASVPSAAPTSDEQLAAGHGTRIVAHVGHAHGVVSHHSGREAAQRASELGEALAGRRLCFLHDDDTHVAGSNTRTTLAPLSTTPPGPGDCLASNPVPTTLGDTPSSMA